MKTAKLFRSGRNQAVRIPKEFRFEGAEVFIKKTGNAVLLIPYLESWQTLFDSLDQFSDDFMERLNDYHLTPLHRGETAQNVMKVFHLMEHMPDIRLFVHVNPVFCCPALTSESMFTRLEKEIGIPIVSITYDGTETPHNRILRPYLHFLKEEARSSGRLN